MEIAKAYNPKEYEDKIYQDWESNGFFNPDNLDLPADAPTYSIVLPPPNITDKLHLGHASMLAIEDLMIRFHRMSGYRTLWLPGTDHAAIATQNVVEKKLLKEERLTRHDLGREKFLERVWQFLRETQSTILKQTRKMGASLDWSREAFTLDDKRQAAVKQMFVDMYQAGVIYNGERVVNWCPRCQSTLADDEVEYSEQKAKLYTFRYSKDFPFAIATTRPETKLGDTAVAVNPKDKRYEKYIGQTFDVDFCGVKLKIKVIANWQVEMTFGTGALGVTPAHSMVDAQMALDNGLPTIKVIDEDGRIAPGFNYYSGKTAVEAREMIVEKLRENELLEQEEEIDNNLSQCYRCGTAIEPLPSKQWFIDVDKKLASLGEKSLKEKAIAAAESGEIKFIPDRFTKRYLDWMNNLHDWCISRQIWFGHRIPVWYKKDIHETEIIFQRHGESVANVQDFLNSDVTRRDVVLTEIGREQVREAAKRWRDEKIDAIYASDFERTKESAEIIAQELNLPVVYDGRLREVGVGRFEGSKRGGDFDRLRDQFALWQHANPEEIESFDQLKARVSEFIDEIVEKYPGKKILVVTHGDVERVAPGYHSEKLTDEQIFQLGIPDVGQWRKISVSKREPSEFLELNFREAHAFDAIKSGQKTIETRAMNPEEPLRYFGDIKAGQEIVLNLKQKHHVLDSLKVKVKSVAVYKNIKELLASCDAKKIWSSEIKNEDKEALGKHLLNFYQSIPGYMDKIKRQGIWAMEIDHVEPYGKNVTVKVSVDDINDPEWEQDPDTLDTWFSSGMWTFSTLGWPDCAKASSGRPVKTGDLARFHPTQMLETGYEIITLWVSRMIMMSYFALGEIPFENVYLHGMVLDKNGKKMSKSKGNGIDPMEVIEKYGTDAVRLSLLLGSTPGNDTRVFDEKIEGFRNLVNKIWNIGRFIIENAEAANIKIDTEIKPKTLADKWILSRFEKLKIDVTENIKSYNFSAAGESLREFTWSELADWYLEISKVERDKDAILLYILRDLLTLWHPFIPFVTEAMWENLAQPKKLIVTDWPKVNEGLLNDAAEKEFATVQEIISIIRTLRAQYQIDPVKKLNILVKGENKAFREQAEVIKVIARIETIGEVTERPENSGVAVVGKTEIYISLEGLVDFEKEKERVVKEIANLEKYIAGVERKLSNAEYVNNAPKEIVARDQKLLAEAQEKIEKFRQQIETLK